MKCEVGDWFDTLVVLGTDGEGQYVCLCTTELGIRYLEASSYVDA
jgi:hypothetical protein